MMSFEERMRVKVAGVTFEGREQFIRKMAVGDKVILVREPENEFDPKAVAVVDGDGNKLGYIPRKSNHRFQKDGLHGEVVRVTTDPALTAGLTIEVIM